ncbi:MAG TPA: pilin [Candidatus Dojkabacteria bacterium]|jgi:type IV secretory pathway VirB2 component (pilin)|nr:pilin [Candidatus Dojkabacteria bacterium]
MEWWHFIENFDRVESASLQDFIANLFDFAMTFSVVIGVVALIIAGFKFMLSRGDSEKIKEATRSLLFALIGLVIVFISPTVVKFVIDNFL